MSCEGASRGQVGIGDVFQSQLSHLLLYNTMVGIVPQIREKATMDIDYAHTSPNFNDRRDSSVDIVVLHYTGMDGGQEPALQRLCSKESKVSSHYVISRTGQIHALVDEKYRAWHAGEAIWNGVRDINSRSIGIELVHSGHDFQDTSPFPVIQMQSLIMLCRDILSRHEIAPRNIVGHSDIAPERKKDPGEWFDWMGLATHHIGLWEDVGKGAGGELPVANHKLPGTNHELPAANQMARLLHRIGYGDKDRGDSDHWNQCLVAFQRRFLPDHLGHGANPPTRARVAQIARLFNSSP